MLLINKFWSICTVHITNVVVKKINESHRESLFLRCSFSLDLEITLHAHFIFS